MKHRSMVVATGVFTGVLLFMSAVTLNAADEVVLSGKLVHGRKRIVTVAGEQYTIIPDESIERELTEADGHQVKLTGVTYTSHGHKMITAYELKIFKP